MIFLKIPFLEPKKCYLRTPRNWIPQLIHKMWMNHAIRIKLKVILRNCVVVSLGISTKSLKSFFPLPSLALTCLIFGLEKVCYMKMQWKVVRIQDFGLDFKFPWPFACNQCLKFKKKVFWVILFGLLVEPISCHFRIEKKSPLQSSLKV